MEETNLFTVTPGGEIAQAPKTSVEIIRGVMDTAIKNRALIDDKKAKISAAITQTRAKIKEIKTPAEDEFINKLIVKANNAVSEMESLRKAYTGTVNAWLKAEIAPENELKLEIAPLVEMRNARAKALTQENAKRQAEIDKEKNRKIYEAEVKSAMKFSFESGVIDKVVAFEKSVEDYFMKNLTAANKAGFKAKLEGFKPNLKEDFFISLFQVDYDVLRMSPDEFDALVVRAKTYFIYENFNKEYQTACKEILQKWIDKIDSRVRELEVLAQGGKEAERASKIIAEREADRLNQIKADAELKKAKAQASANDQAQGEILSAEFKAQAQGQTLVEPANVRNSTYFTIDNPEDTVEVGRIIASIIMHTIPNKSKEDRIKMVLQHDKDGRPKKDEDGDPVYTPGVQFWLDMAASMGYNLGAKGLTMRTKTRAINKKK
jgi:hypothetical protein